MGHPESQPFPTSILNRQRKGQGRSEKQSQRQSNHHNSHCVARLCAKRLFTCPPFPRDGQQAYERGTPVTPLYRRGNGRTGETMALVHGHTVSQWQNLD